MSESKVWKENFIFVRTFRKLLIMKLDRSNIQRHQLSFACLKEGLIAVSAMDGTVSLLRVTSLEAGSYSALQNRSKTAMRWIEGLWLAFLFFFLLLFFGGRGVNHMASLSDLCSFYSYYSGD